MPCRSPLTSPCPTDLGPPFAGIAALPAGPFAGSFSFDGPLAPNLSDSLVALTAFDLTIGSLSWGLADLVGSAFSTDAIGQITGFSLFAVNDVPAVAILESSRAVGFAWIAYSPGDPCSYSVGPDDFDIVSGNCIAGEPGSVAFSQSTEVPEPATLLLLGGGIAGLGWIGRRRKTS